MNFEDLAPHPLDDDAPGGLVINPHSALGKELRKWEQFRSELVPRGTSPGNPYVYRPYPKMVYVAQIDPVTLQAACLLPVPDPYSVATPDEYQRACLRVDSFNRSCTRIVADESEERIANGQGCAETPALALAQYEARQQAIGNAAAEAAFQARGMSATAQAEFKAAGESTHQHVTDIKGTKKGAKAVTATEEG
jgi:hypothetical protein